jgi:hypothetical protein
MLSACAEEDKNFSHTFQAKLVPYAVVDHVLMNTAHIADDFVTLEWHMYYDLLDASLCFTISNN